MSLDMSPTAPVPPPAPVLDQPAWPASPGAPGAPNDGGGDGPPARPWYRKKRFLIPAVLLVIVIGSMERYAVHYSASTALSRVIAAGRVGSTTECTVLGQLAPRVVDAALHLLAHFS